MNSNHTKNKAKKNQKKTLTNEYLILKTISFNRSFYTHYFNENYV